MKEQLEAIAKKKAFEELAQSQDLKKALDAVQ